MKERSNARSTFVVAGIFAVSALSGFLREVVFAAYFGTTRQADAFQVALLLPNFFLELLGEATLVAAIVPVFTSRIAPQEPRERRIIVGSMYSLASLALGAITAVGIIVAPWLAKLFAPGFNPSELQLTTLLMRIMLPAVFFVGIANLLTGILYAVKRFGLASATGIVWNLAIVATTIPLANRYGVAAAAVGVLIGAALQLVIMLPPLIKEGLFPAIGFRFRDPAMSQTWALFWPIVGGALAVQFVRIADKMIASFLPTGSIAALNYAEKIAGGPGRVFVLAVSVVLFPSLAQKVTDSSPDLPKTLAQGLNRAAVLTLPWLALFVALRVPIVELLLQHGAFTAESTKMVAMPMAIYCLAQFAASSVTLVSNAFYSFHDSRTPTIITVSTKVLRVALALSFVPFFSYNAIALATFVTSNLTLLLLLVFIRKRMPELSLARIGWSMARIAVAAAASATVGWATYAVLAHAATLESFVAQAFAVAGAFVPALASFLLFARVLRIQEASEMTDRARSLARARLAR